MKNDNKIAKLLFGIGILEIIAGILLGILFGKVEVEGFYSSYTEFSWPLFLLWSFGGFISGIVFIGFSEIINLLDNIYKQTKK